MKKILVIEDDTTLSQALQVALEKGGYTVSVAPSSELGLVMVVTDKPDLILLDVMTYSLHASTFLQRLRQLPEGKNDSKNSARSIPRAEPWSIRRAEPGFFAGAVSATADSFFHASLWQSHRVFVFQ